MLESSIGALSTRSWSRDQATQMSGGAECHAELSLMSQEVTPAQSQSSEGTRLLAEIEHLNRTQATHLLDRALWEKRAAQLIEMDRQVSEVDARSRTLSYCGPYD
jgi:hypothetical protein